MFRHIFSIHIINVLYYKKPPVGGSERLFLQFHLSFFMLSAKVFFKKGSDLINDPLLFFGSIAFKS